MSVKIFLSYDHVIFVEVSRIRNDFQILYHDA